MDTPGLHLVRQGFFARHRRIGSVRMLSPFWMQPGVALTQGCFMHRVFDLKVALRELTTVPEERQKILGLVKGKLPPDQERMYVPCFRVSLLHQNLVLATGC